MPKKKTHITHKDKKIDLDNINLDELFQPSEDLKEARAKLSKTCDVEGCKKKSLIRCVKRHINLIGSFLTLGMSDKKTLT